MNFSFIVFILVSILIIGGSFYFNYTSGRKIQAVLITVGLLAFSIFFGLRWFNRGSATTTPTKSWPPTINMCPDFLALATVNSEVVCVDPIGVSQGGMEKWTNSTQTDEKYLFHLFLNKNSTERMLAICKQCADKKVTWGGVFDGTVCLDNLPPAPSGSS